MTLTMTRTLAYAIGQDAGNKSMRQGGRDIWNEDDFDAATDALKAALALVP